MSDVPELKLQMSTLESHHDNTRGLLQTVLNDLPRLRVDIASVLQAISAHKEEVKLVVAELNKLKSLVAIIREEFARNLTSAHSSLLKTIDDKIKILPPLIASHDALQAQVDKFELTLESVALDSRNAILKTNNVEVVTMLNRKKLENIQLKLNQKQLPSEA